MFYKVLFILAIINFIREINRYFREYKAYSAGTDAEEIPIGLYLKIGLSALFYIMVIAVATMPRLLWW